MEAFVDLIEELHLVDLPNINEFILGTLGGEETMRSPHTWTDL